MTEALDKNAKIELERKIELQNVASRSEIDNKLRLENRLNDYNDNTKYIEQVVQVEKANSCTNDLSDATAYILNLNNIRGGSKMIKGGGCGCSGMSGGCFTCKKGVKNITLIYKTVHVIIPELYSKYNKEASMKGISKKVKKVKKVKKI